MPLANGAKLPNVLQNKILVVQFLKKKKIYYTKMKLMLMKQMKKILNLTTKGIMFPWRIYKKSIWKMKSQTFEWVVELRRLVRFCALGLLSSCALICLFC